MKNITQADFLDALLRGDCEFKDVQVHGDVDLQDVVVGKLVLDHVMFAGEVTGRIRVVDTILICSPTCIYFADTTPLLYSGSLIKDLCS